MVPERFAPVLAELQPLAERFAAAGHRLYVVGGTVRDLLLGREITGDYDCTTDALPAVTKRILSGWADAVWTQGERFGTIGAKKGARDVRDHDPSGRGLRPRFAQARGRLRRRDRGRPVAAGLHRQRHGAAHRRHRARPSSSIPSAGAADLVSKRLRTPLAPEISFSDDPLRMLRAARFIAGYGLEPEPGAGGRRRGARATAWRSSRPSASATSSTS